MPSLNSTENKIESINHFGTLYPSDIAGKSDEIINKNQTTRINDEKWSLVMKSDHFWRKVTIFDEMWSFLMKSDHFWWKVTIFDEKWSLVMKSDVLL